MENNLHKIWVEEMRVEPLLETDAGEIYIQPSDDGTKLEYGTISNIGLLVTGDMEYDFDFSLDENIQALADIIYEEYGYPDFNESKKYLQVEKIKDNAIYVNRPELNDRKQLIVSLYEDDELKDTFGITDTNVSDNDIRKRAKKQFNNISDDIKIVRNESLKRRNEAFIVGNDIFISDLDYTINYSSGNKYFNSASYIPVKDISQFTLETIKDTIIKKMREQRLDKKYTFNKDDLKYDETTGIIELDNAPLLNTEYIPEPAKDGTIKLTCKLWVHPKDSDIK